METVFQPINMVAVRDEDSSDCDDDHYECLPGAAKQVCLENNGGAAHISQFMDMDGPDLKEEEEALEFDNEDETEIQPLELTVKNDNKVVTPNPSCSNSSRSVEPAVQLEQPPVCANSRSSEVRPRVREGKQLGDPKKQLRIIEGRRTYICEICSKPFRQLGHLTRHLRTHTNERPYKCSVCSKSFTDQTNLKTHLRTHTNERPYKCTICPKSFADQTNMKTHMRTHTNERPFKCDVCEKLFTRRDHMKKHRLTHTNERAFSCEICKKSFTRHDNLKAHQRLHLNDLSQLIIYKM